MIIRMWFPGENSKLVADEVNHLIGLIECANFIESIDYLYEKSPPVNIYGPLNLPGIEDFRPIVYQKEIENSKLAGVQIQYTLLP